MQPLIIFIARSSSPPREKNPFDAIASAIAYFKAIDKQSGV